MTPQERELRALVVYESGFGNTEIVARAVADGLRHEGVVVTFENVRDAGPPDRTTFDLLVVGAPTHGFSLSRPSTRQDAVRQGAPERNATTGVREWIDAMSTTDRTPRLAAAFDTRVTKVRRVPMAASRSASHLLTKLGFVLISPPTGFLVSDVPGPLEAHEPARAEAWGRSLAAAARHRVRDVSSAG
ncbi:MAG: flavodoxin family protein [Nocardioides sp.]